MPVEQLIYTDRPRGKGKDPACAGYQVKACSDGLSAEARRQLDNLSMHYGDAVYVHAPRDAKDREMQWRTRADQVNDVPDEVLREFPVIWSYDRLSEEQFALTRINYTGITHDGRFGNFLAHALVLSPDDLVAHRFNPLSPSRANLFKSRDESDDTKLDTLDLGQTDENPAVYQILHRQPIAQHLPAMVAALCRATPAQRPVVVCLNNWQHAAQLVEALLNLLPPPARARTTFCTYESDRKYLVPTSAGTRPKDVTAAHHLIVLCAEDTRRFDLRPDEYRSTFAIFNFIDGQFSPPGEITRYAEFAALAASDDKKLNRLRAHHELVERLQVGQDLADWNELVAAEPLSQPKLPFEALIAGARALVAVTRHPRQADVALTILRPHVQRLANDDQHAEIQSLASEVIVNLSDRSQTDPLADDLFTLARQVFPRGQGRTADALLNARGPARDNTLIALLDDAIKQDPGSFQASWDQEEREKILDLLLDGLQITRGTGGDKSPLLDDLLIFSFRKASEMGMAADLWYRGGGGTAKARFSGEPDVAQPRLIGELAALLPPNQCPEASAWLNLCRIKIAAMDENELIAVLTRIAYDGSQCGEAEAFTDESLRLAAAKLERPLRRAEALGCMAAAADGTASAEKYLAAYQKCKAEITEARELRGLRVSLAEAGANSILVPELLDETLPWGEESETRLKAWLDCVPKSNVGGAILDAARKEVASVLRHRDKPKETHHLAEALLERGLEKTPGNGTLALGEALTFAQPLGPLQVRPHQLLEPIANHLGREAQDRLRLLYFLREVLNESRKPDWALTKFPADQPGWRMVATLPPDEKNAVVSQCMNTFQESGITNPADTLALVRMFSALGDRETAMAESVAGAVHHLLTERDQTTQVNTAMTFVLCALGEQRDKAPWGRMLRAIADRFDRKTKRELEDHLERGFRHHDPKAEERLGRLCDAAGLSKPKSAEPANTAQDANNAESGQRNAGLFGKALGWLKKEK